MIDEQLGSPVKQVAERPLTVVGVEAVVLLDGNPGQLASLLRQLVPKPGVLLFADEQLVA